MIGKHFAWTQFSLDAEVETFGTSRIAKAGQELEAKCERLCSRGIEDMRHEILTLKNEVFELQAALQGGEG